MLDLTVAQWIVVGLSAVLFGFSRTGIRGSTFLAIPLFAEIFGGRVSSGIVLLILISGDFVAIRYYLKNTEWRFIVRLIPSMAVGLGLGAYVGARIEDQTFVTIMAVIVLVSAGLLLLRELRGKETRIPQRWWFAGVLGLLAGFSSMLGNVAGPIANLYFLSLNLPKAHFVGTAAWFFFIMNIAKVPVHLFAWQTITLDSVLLALLMVPAVLVGAALGVWFLRAIPERPFRMVMMGLVIVASIRLLLV